jgi:hypothetical protein
MWNNTPVELPFFDPATLAKFSVADHLNHVAVAALNHVFGEDHLHTLPQHQDLMNWDAPAELEAVLSFEPEGHTLIFVALFAPSAVAAGLLDHVRAAAADMTRDTSADNKVRWATHFVDLMQESKVAKWFGKHQRGPIVTANEVIEALRVTHPDLPMLWQSTQLPLNLVCENQAGEVVWGEDYLRAYGRGIYQDEPWYVTGLAI